MLNYTNTKLIDFHHKAEAPLPFIMCVLSRPRWRKQIAASKSFLYYIIRQPLIISDSWLPPIRLLSIGASLLY
ncbi:hypothetical protein FGO68_gene7243 [Halteria grandinella]|uniref:Uncharacterized protein n=1 Tax=Halteria grandinella TaxID=5974 RepID=A0A8J8T833_HALGN|nr:hypothetical protein FGO68_gene7243 [Halteria grandinella]